jgi:RNA-directed DNA polymerase
MDAFLYWKQFRFGLRRHPNKGKEWITRKYFSNFNRFRPKDTWVFGTSDISFALKHRWFKIARHKLIPNNYSPDDTRLRDFWWKRQTIGV